MHLKRRTCTFDDCLLLLRTGNGNLISPTQRNCCNACHIFNVIILTVSERRDWLAGLDVQDIFAKGSSSCKACSDIKEVNQTQVEFAPLFDLLSCPWVGRPSQPSLQV
jgi:hypothetical protein